MIPSKSGNNSRRSSILKPPKPRHPLQNLNFNSSSNENSPATTTKIKRRVSFAEKKHVKEFCNSLEQGTVWDNTYEEHDISDVKISCSFNQEKYESKNIHKENIFNNIHENDMQFVCNETIIKDVNIEKSNSCIINTVEKENCQDEMLLNESLIISHNVDTEKNESIFSRDSQLNNNHISKSIIVYEDSDKKLIEKSNQISDYLESNICNFDDNKLNITSDQNVCMDLTEVVSPVVNSINRDKTKKMFKNASIELINDILPTISKENFEQFNKSNVTESSITNQDKSMEITMPQPSVIKLNKNIDNVDINTFCVDNKTKRLDISMEITSAIPTSLCNLPNNNDINYDVSNLISYNNDNKTIPFHDISMSITKAVETIVHKSSDSSPVVQKMSQYNITKQDEETKLLNTSMEITKVVPINVHSVIKNYGQNAIKFDTKNNVKKLRYNSDIYETLTNCDRTKFYNNEEMEFTTAITSLPAICQNNLQLCMQDISCAQLNSSNSISDNSRNHSLTNKTIIFDNNSMTVTKIVPVLDRKHEDIIIRHSQAKIDEIDTCSSKIRQTILSDSLKKKDITDVSSNKDNLLKNITTITAIPSLPNSNIISNNNGEMEFTTAITSTIHQNNLQIQNISCTQSNFSNSISDNCKNHLLSKTNKTIVFNDNSMIITKVVPINDKKQQDIMITDSHTETNSDICSGKIRQSILHNSIEKSTKHVNSCLLNTNIENNAIQSSTPIKIQDFVNIKPSMSSHESMQQQTFASALKKITQK
ncbi:probable serine/threonine-protein kinase DDB_G0282963 isoform X3 [Apis florea]|uniref:probable serine/threonine-protein kinase DDB_G0282963 isoform X2 n=1 Tax=Apis florea TaxID=7463 RepID=UPI0012FE9D78|nr:probable serine/threonine-protein kinase DDB_G0282963 isoform X2 [Apis florea]XP_031772843.1 probable serine/threonine-protein kinase DDB_G0282963 isoform X3 [Apis florea]